MFEFTVREFLKFGSIMLIKNPICLCSCLLIIMVVLEHKMENNKNRNKMIFESRIVMIQDMIMNTNLAKV